MADPKNPLLSLNRSLTATFAVLRQPKYQAGIQVLERGFMGGNAMIRFASLHALLERGTALDYAAILRCIDRSGPAELEAIRPHVHRMTEAIDQGLRSNEPETRQRALWAIAKLEIESHFRFLIDTVCDPSDPQQMVAMELTSHLAKCLGHRARKGDMSKEPQRLELLRQLMRGLDSYAHHRVQALLDWLGLVAHWDDPILVEMLRDPSNAESSHRIAQHLERSKAKECMELVAGFLWSQNADVLLALLASRRNDPAFVEMIKVFYQSLGPTKELKRTINVEDAEWSFLSHETFEDDRISNSAKICLVELMTLKSSPTEDILPRIAWLLERVDSSLELPVKELLEHQRPMNTDLAVLALSDALDAPDIESSEPPPWKQALRAALETVIDVYPRLSERLQSALANYFRDFNCEILLEKLLDWPGGHLSAYAKLTRIAHPDFIDDLMSELNAQAPQRRQRGVQAARLFGLDQALEDLVIGKLDDPVDEVRVEAIHALADASDRQTAIGLVHPLILDSNPAIQQAAEVALQHLRGHR
jgi:hypothetical protein